MPLCKKCGVKVEFPFIYCDPCGDAIARSRSQWARCGGRVIELKLKAAADESGNPKVYTAAECSQEFLKSLIPK
jgi:hypothetical protein